MMTPFTRAANGKNALAIVRARAFCALIGRVASHHNFPAAVCNDFLPNGMAALIIPCVLRRVHVSHLAPGALSLNPAEAHHVRNVLRMQAGDQIELFDDAGATAVATLRQLDSTSAIADVAQITPAASAPGVVVACAIPKGERADWMVEKLSELGVHRWIPLLTARSVVWASGQNKIQRWRRIAVESAKQSRRAGVMLIDEPAGLSDTLENLPCRNGARYLSTAPDAPSIVEALSTPLPTRSVFVGPEGGWAPEELSLFAAQHLTPARLTVTILRVETAAVAAAAVLACFQARDAQRP
jgi:16S rRNA (uracil1498-N3)-methyltransferase